MVDQCGNGVSDEELVTDARRRGEFRHIRVTEGLRLLDVGCGGGFFLRIAARLGAVVEGVEPSEFGVKIARASGLEVFEGTVEEFLRRHPEKRFDVITANHVVEHVPNPVEVLGAMGKLLAPGGYAWVAVPNADCIFGRKLKGRWLHTDLPIHLMQFTPQSLIEAGSRAGLELVSWNTYSLPMAIAFSIRQYLRSYFIPHRLTNHLGFIDTHFAPSLARRLDSRRRGDAVIIRLRNPAHPRPTNRAETAAL
jgi:SAM-dependent methyltransferase